MAKRSALPIHSVVLGIMLIAALGIRVYRIEEPPLDFVGTRQYYGMSNARLLYYRAIDTVPEWKRRAAEQAQAGLGTLEPQVMEVLACIGYRIAGSEQPWIPRTLSALFWLLGGVILFQLARRLFSVQAALLAAGIHLFLPFAIIASRSFQPDPLMVTIFIAALLAIVSYHDRPSRRGLALAGIVSGAAIFVKPMCLFALFGAFYALLVKQEGIRAASASRRALAFASASLAPTLIFFAANSGAYAGLARGSFLPWLWTSATFWEGWRRQIGNVVGLPVFLSSVVTFLTLAEGRARTMLAGLWLGYFVYGLVFTYQMHTHNYYHLQLIPIVALSLAPLGSAIARRLATARRISRIGAASAAVVAVVLCMRAASAKIGVDGWQDRVRVYEEIGRAVNHSTKAILLADNYGGPLRYHGHLGGATWPCGADFLLSAKQRRPTESGEQRLGGYLQRGFSDFFIVTEMRELKAQPDLELLLDRYPKLAETDRYVIFDLRGGRPASQSSPD